MPRNFRKRGIEPDTDDGSDDEDTRRYASLQSTPLSLSLALLGLLADACLPSSHRSVALEEIKYMQKLRERKLGIPAVPAAASTNGSSARGRLGSGTAAAGEAEKEDLVLQDTFAQETAVTIEDPNMYSAALVVVDVDACCFI